MSKRVCCLLDKISVTPLVNKLKGYQNDPGSMIDVTWNYSLND